MKNIDKIVNLKIHPIRSNDYIKYCFNELKNKSILILNNFLKTKSLKSILDEALLLEKKAFY